jgi:hypothetical protein
MPEQRLVARAAHAAALPRGCGGRPRPLAVHPRTRRANQCILKWRVGQAAGKLPYATTLWLLFAVAHHATAASSDFFCVPFRGGRQRARLPTVQTTPPMAPGALYGAFALQAATRTPTASSAWPTYM